MRPASPAHSDDFVSFPGKVGHPVLKAKQNQFHSGVLKNVGRHQLYLITCRPRYYVHKPCPLFTCTGDRIPVGARFSAPVQTDPGAHPATCTMGTGSFPGVKSGRVVTLTPHPLLVPWSRKSRAIPLLPLWAGRPVQSLSACTRLHFTLPYLYLHVSCRLVSVLEASSWTSYFDHCHRKG